MTATFQEQDMLMSSVNPCVSSGIPGGKQERQDLLRVKTPSLFFSRGGGGKVRRGRGPVLRGPGRRRLRGPQRPG